MANWFMRVQHNFELVKRFPLVTIGFDIDRDITMMEDIDTIRDYLENELNFAPGGVRLDGSQINNFINEMKIDDTIISPFAVPTGKLKMGKIISECRTAESFFGEIAGLENFFNNYTGSQEPERIKPTRKVEWQRDISFGEFAVLSPLKPDPTVLQQTIHFLPEG